MSSQANLDGPFLAPASGGPAKQLVVLVHGYGADGNDLMPLASVWQRVLPEAAFTAPNGPEQCASFPIGRQWFPLALGDRSGIAAGLAAAAPVLDAFLDARLARLGLDNKSLALVGFSQGAMLALHVGLRRPGPIAGIVSFSGLLGVPPEPRDTPFPPVLLAHGSEDQLVPSAALPAAERQLIAAGVGVEVLLRPGLGHGIDDTEMALGARFLVSAFAQ